MMTFVLILLGTSTPTVPLPGTGARMLIRSAFNAAERLLLKLAIRSSLIPGAGSSSYRVIVGPLVMSPRETSIPN